MSGDLVFRSVKLGSSNELVDVQIARGRIARVGHELIGSPEHVVDGQGGALLPGLHDHHIHLLAWAAAENSLQCGPPSVRTGAQLAEKLRAAVPMGGWIRGVGYHESVAGDLDAASLDRIRDDVPVRVQHRSGALWVLNTAGMRMLGQLDTGNEGIERDALGRETGRLWRIDSWLGSRVKAPPPDLAPLFERLASFGVVGLSDATPDISSEVAEVLRTAARGRARLQLLGADDEPSEVPRKIVVSDHLLPGLDELAERITRSRPRPVAVHCVTREALWLCIAALEVARPVRGDRLEHAAVVPAEALEHMHELGVTVVTQPSFINVRGDDYIRDVDVEDRPFLWPHASLVQAGVPVACSSDAPYGPPDPWMSIAAAVTRRTATGQPLNPVERVKPARALDGWLTPLDMPGGSPRAVQPGELADLVLLDCPIHEALAAPDASHVRMTFVGGDATYCRDAP